VALFALFVLLQVMKKCKTVMSIWHYWCEVLLSSVPTLVYQPEPIPPRFIFPFSLSLLFPLFSPLLFPSSPDPFLSFFGLFDFYFLIDFDLLFLSILVCMCVRI